MHQIGHFSLFAWVQVFKTLFLNCNFLPIHNLTHNQTWALSIYNEHPFAVEIGVIGDQLNSLKAVSFIILIVDKLLS